MKPFSPRLANECLFLLTVSFCIAAVDVVAVRAGLAQGTDPVRPGREDRLLAIVVEGKHGFIDLTGRIVIPPTFDFTWQFSEGLAVAWLNGRAGFVDRAGMFVIPPRFTSAKSFHEGLAAVQLEERWGFVRPNGQFAIQPQFEDTRWFSEELAQARVKGKWGYIDKRGTFVIPPKYSAASPFIQGRAYVWPDKDVIFINRAGEQVPRDPNDLIPQERNGRWGFVAPNGTTAVEFTFDAVNAFSEGLAAVKIGDRWGFIDRRGRLVIPVQFDDGWGPAPPEAPPRPPPIGSFKEGIAAVHKDGSWRLIDKTGAIAIPGQFLQVDIEGFRDGVVAVCGKKGWGYIDRSGRVIWPWE